MSNEYIVKLKELSDQLEPTYAKLLNRKNKPVTFEFVELSTIPTDDIVKFHVEQFGEDPKTTRQRYQGKCGLINFDLTNSFAIQQDNQIIAILTTLLNPSFDTRFLYLVAVTKRLRGTWANVCIKYLSAKALIQKGFVNICFYADDSQRDARNHLYNTNFRELNNDLYF